MIYNDLRDFIDGGGVKTGKVLCGANPFSEKKEKISSRLKKFFEKKKKEKIENLKTILRPF